MRDRHLCRTVGPGFPFAHPSYLLHVRVINRMKRGNVVIAHHMLVDYVCMGRSLHVRFRLAVIMGKNRGSNISVVCPSRR